MSELTRDVDLADSLKVAVDVVHRYCKEAGIAEHKLTVGGNAVSLFDKVAAMKVLTPKIAADKQRDDAKRPAPPPAPDSLAQQIHVAVTALGGSMAEVQRMLANVDEDSAKAVQVLEAVEMQQPLLLKAINAVREDFDARLLGMAEVIQMLALRLPAPAAPDVLPGGSDAYLTGTGATPPVNKVLVAPAAKPAKPARPPLVVVVGVHASDRAALVKEFGELFDLHIYAPIEAEGAAFVNKVNKAAAVLVLPRVCSVPTMNALKTAGGRYMVIEGRGITKVRDALTELYAAQ